MGDDEKFEYIYKFVTRDRFDPKNPAANRDLLDHGTLYAARFDADGTGAWLPLVHDEKGPLNSRAGFANQGDVVHQGARRRGLVRRDAHGSARGRRAQPGHGPHLHRLHQVRGPRHHRGTSTSGAGASVDVGVNAANPRPNNLSGHIIEIPEAGDDATATRFEWNVFLLAGNPDSRSFHRGCARSHPGQARRAGHVLRRLCAMRRKSARCIAPTISASTPPGRLWIVTDTDNRGQPNNGCSSCRPTGRSAVACEQLASGPVGCELCGCEFTPDGRTLFLSVQHPGEGGTIEKPRSHWPDGPGMPARAALLAIEREDGRTI